MPHTQQLIPAIVMGLILIVAGRGPVVAIAGPPKQPPAEDGEREDVLRVVRSKNFHILTDLPEKEAEQLSARLETMLRLIAAYWGRPHRGVIQMYVVEDFSRWPAEQIAQMDPNGVRSVRQGGGLTVSRTLVSGNAFQSSAVVYAVADGGTPQHEAVHAYCTHAFGTCGPVWYAEGMAEVGNYWQAEDDKSVQAPPQVIRFLRHGEVKPLQAIVDNPLESSGDSWQSYASRWALCHLLGHNSNYTQRFKPLGLQLLDLSARDVSFWQVYGSHAEEIEFEYRMFLQQIEPGYRVDLCSWDWKTKFTPSRGGRPLVSKIAADRGWQASRIHLVAGTLYEYAAEGNWTFAPDGPSINADGTDNGTGRLIGTVFTSYELSGPFDLGTSGSFTAPATGDLYVRCRDDWGQIADNSGTLTVRIKPVDRGRPLSGRNLARPAGPSLKDDAAPDQPGR
ncbi:MAG: hypothetical protein AB7U20_08260 [Planctomycetaceae bacterium]